VLIPCYVLWMDQLSDEQKAAIRKNLRKWRVKPGPPIITIFVRHASNCKYCEDETSKRCDCPKHLRWTREHKQHRASAHTRSWAEAERQKRDLEDQLAGRAPDPKAQSRLAVEDACERFMLAKKNARLEAPSLQKLQKVVDRIAMFCAASKLTFLDEVNRTHVETWDWSRYFKTTHSLRANQNRVRAFFRYFHDAGITVRNPAAAWERIKGKMEQVRGFTPEEFDHILASIPNVERRIVRSIQEQRRSREGTLKATPLLQQRLRALVLLMRYSGLAIIDAVSLERANIRHKEDEYRVYIKTRQKVSKRDRLQAVDNAIPPFVGKEVLAVLNGTPKYIFWNRGEHEVGNEETEKRRATGYWHKWIRALLDTAGLPNATSHMFRHTLAIEMIRHGASFEDVAAALGNTVGVVAKFYSHEWAKVRQGRTDNAIKAAW
jgi:integrase/recombinase XerD